MIIVKKETDSFDKLISSNVVVVDFFAPWCGPCKPLSPILEHIVKELELDLIKINTDDNKEIAEKYNILSAPTLAIFKDGKLIATKSGKIQTDEIKEWIKSNI